MKIVLIVVLVVALVFVVMAIGTAISAKQVTEFDGHAQVYIPEKKIEEQKIEEIVIHEQILTEKTWQNSVNYWD